MRDLFPPEKRHFNLPVVRVAFAIPTLAALLSSMSIAWSLIDTPFCFDAAGFDRFAVAYRVPAAFLALALSLVGILGANHRSAQTNKQMEETLKQNYFSNYYKHADEFIKYRQTFTNPRFEVLVNRKIHINMFPAANVGNFNCSSEFLWAFTNQLKLIKQAVLNLESGGWVAWDQNSFRLNEQVERLLKLFLLRQKHDPEEGKMHLAVEGWFYIYKYNF